VNWSRLEDRLLRPFRSEGAAFRVLLWVVAVAVAVVILALVVRAVT
jgi:hypothetical protein